MDTAEDDNSYPKSEMNVTMISQSFGERALLGAHDRTQPGVTCRMQDMSWATAPGIVHLRKQIVATGDLGSASSIMFAESRHLSVTGVDGSVTTELIRMDDRGIAIGRVVSTGHEIELKDSGNFTLLLPSAGRLDIQIAGTDYRSIPGHPLVFRPTERRTRASSMVGGKFQATTLQVSTDRLDLLASRAGLSSVKAFAKDANVLSASVRQDLARQLLLFANEVFWRPDSLLPVKVLEQIFNMIDEYLFELIGVTAETRSFKSILPALHRVRQAEDLMHARSDEPLSLLDLADMLQISLRSLQLAFQEVHDLTPRAVLNRIRLEKARARLLTADVDSQVTTIAHESGLSHLGRFAQAYARAYGERPSETLYRRRA